MPSVDPVRYWRTMSRRNWTAAFRVLLTRAWPWHTPSDQLSARERFESIRAERPVEFFVVTNLRDFAGQKDLHDFLWSEFPVLTQTDHYVIFDLRSSMEGE